MLETHGQKKREMEMVVIVIVRRMTKREDRIKKQIQQLVPDLNKDLTNSHNPNKLPVTPLVDLLDTYSDMVGPHDLTAHQS